MSGPPAEAWPGRIVGSLIAGTGAYFALFVLVHAVLALTTDGATWADVGCLLLVAVPQGVLIAWRGRDPSRWRIAAVCAALAGAAALGLWTMHPGRLDETYGAWFLGAITIDLLGLTLLGRWRSAWATLAVVAALAVAWAVWAGEPPAAGLALVVRHAATLLVGTALAAGLRRSRAATAVFAALRTHRAAEEQAARARRVARRAAVEQVLEQAGPLLTAIAAGRRFTAEDRRQMLVLEGALRDQIRTPVLVRGALRDSVDAARRRGVNVLLMDEAEEADPSARADAARWLAERLDAAVEGGFTGRVRAHGEGLRVSAVTGDVGESRSFPGAGER